jgi:hypothetical protein
MTEECSPPNSGEIATSRLGGRTGKHNEGRLGLATNFVRSLWRDEEGVILPYVTVLSVVVVGVSVLALDGARYESLQTQLQNGADALALAGAAELNRLPATSPLAKDDAITRAVAAICGKATCPSVAVANCGSVSFSTPSATLVSNSDYTVPSDVQVASVYFYSALPAGTTASISSSYQTCDPTQARFVAVNVVPVTMSTLLPASLFGGANFATTQAGAVAGNDPTICNITPLFVCNPYETSGMTNAQATQALRSKVDPVDPADLALGRRTQLLLRTPQRNESYSPGDFGFLEPSVGSLPQRNCTSGGSNGLVEAMAAPTVNACFTQNSLNTQPGNVRDIVEAMNVRFDLFANSVADCETAPGYAPDVNVRKGYTPEDGACGADENNSSATWPPGATGTFANNSNSTAVAFPLDYNLYSNGEVSNSANKGNGNWECGDVTVDTTSPTSGSATLNFAPGATAGITVGMAVSGTNVAPQTTVFAVNSTTVTMTQKSTGSIASGTTITFPGYWSTAHAGNAAALANPPPGCTAPATTSRYNVYLYEISNSYTADYAGGSPAGEQGSGNYCSHIPASTGRRILHVAVLNCLGQAVTNRSSSVPAAAFAKIFLTAPAQVAGRRGGSGYAEITELDKQGDGFLNQTVQLYR